MQPIQLENKDETIGFVGEEIASINGRKEGMSRWVTMTLYRVEGGGYACHRRWSTLVESEEQRCETRICEDELRAVLFLGVGKTAQALYAASGIEKFDEILALPRFDIELGRRKNTPKSAENLPN